MKRSVLITGVAGFMGSHIADKYIELGWDVIGIDNLIGGYLDNVPKKCKFIQQDLDNFSAIEPYFKDVEIVIHAACTAYEGLSVFSPSLISRNTFQISANVFSSCVKHSVKKIVFLSSMARYGTQSRVPFTEDMTPKPQDPYGIAKYASELLLENLAKTHGLDYVIVVPHNIIGPRQKYDDPFRNVASIMINRMLQNKQPIIYGDGNQMRCFSFMDDVTIPITRAADSEKANSLTINIGPDDEFISINQLAKTIAKLINFNLNPIYLPGRPNEVINANCSANLARELLNYKPQVGLENGLKELINWISKKGPKPFKYHLPLEFSSDTTPRTWTSELLND